MPKYEQQQGARKNQYKIDEKSIGKMIKNTGKTIENIKSYQTKKESAKKPNIDYTNQMNTVKKPNVEYKNQLNSKAPNAKVRE